MFATAQRQARLGLVELFGDFGIGADEDRRLALGAFYQALVTGVAAQWLVDPGTTPAGADLLAAVRAVAAGAGRPTAGAAGAGRPTAGAG
jgi:hypothetical protein